MRPLVRGAAAGVVATVPMSAVMLAARKAGLIGQQPPESIVRRAGDLLGAPPGGATAHALGAVAHVGFGATAGAAYALLPRRGRPALRATGLALGIWGASYEGWVPVFGALPAAHEDRPARPWVMVAAHVVFGLVLGPLEQRWRR